MTDHNTSTSANPKSFPCPRCGEASRWQDNPYRPFCSERCKMVDFSAWANEDYKVASEDSPSRVTPEHDQD